MAQKSSPPPIVFILIFLLLAGGGYWFFFMKKPAAQVNTNLPVAPPAALPAAPAAGTAPTSVPAGTTLKIDGATSMVTINENLKRGFQAQFQGSTVTTNAGGSDKGIQDLLAGRVDLAAVSRPLTAQEQSQGLVAVPIATDQIAVVVGKTNPFSGGLTNTQVADIFQGQINNWSAVGGPAAPIQVINRPAVSGTNKSFQELVLKGANFGITPNIITLPRDETTGLLRALGNNGIGYATYAQVATQQTVRVVAIDGVTPGTANYPYQRTLFYIYKNPPTPAVQAFTGYATSPQGQQAMFVGN
ncbi:phosphate ABC transporter substrate-binding protein [Argonema galeatum]|uniref:phosphate ABC transporter substrate-binding protein n=1 Tax=Argonema galeatum TaxID=2942762 RepID=UPI002010E6B0|nr:phosphate ABC transporter substrate-binding protein [Argonema galeatum]MCL1466315.1 substrate-binding domain-containing protein [Argonema galeatum A003/A1]